jgi:cytochrome P450
MKRSRDGGPDRRHTPEPTRHAGLASVDSRSTIAADVLPDLVMPRPPARPLEQPPLLAHLRTSRPVAKVRCPRGIDAWLVTRYDNVRQVLADATGFSSIDAPFGHLTDSWNLGSPPEPGSLIRSDGATHGRLRRRLAKEFTASRMDAYRPYLEGIVDGQIDMLQGKRADLPVDLYDAFALPVAALAICELLGMPASDRAGFYLLAAQINDLTATPRQRRDADAAIHGYLADRVRAELRQPGDNIIGRLVQDNSDHADPLTAEELTTLASTLLVAGQETTANMMSLTIVWLLQHEPVGTVVDVIDDTIEEALRDLAIVQYGVLRRATHDTNLGEHVLEAGDYVVLSIPAANHDPALVVPRHGRPRHVAFGHGPHICLGQHLARAELQIALPRLFRRIPTLRLAAAPAALTYQTTMTVYGVNPLPVWWETVLR